MASQSLQPCNRGFEKGLQMKPEMDVPSRLYLIQVHRVVSAVSVET